MDEQDRTNQRDGEGPLDRVKDAVGELFGGSDNLSAAESTPELIGDEMVMDPHERQDIGMGVTDVESAPYAGSAGTAGMDLVDQDIEGDVRNTPLYPVETDPER